MDIFSIMKQNTVGAKVTEPLKPPKSLNPLTSGPSKGAVPKSGELPPFINPDDINTLNTHLRSKISSMEVEVSFGIFKKIEGKGTFFEPGVSVSQFNDLLHYFSSLFQSGIWGSNGPIPELEVTLEEAENRKDGPRVKKITNSLGHVTWMEKQRHTKETIDNEEWGYRISKSTEKINVSGPENFTPNFWRKKERRTFFVVDKKSDIYGVQFDLTVVKETKERFDHRTKTSRMCTDLKYEVEIERKSVIEFPVFEKAIGYVINVIQHASDPSQLLTMHQREAVISFHNRLFQQDDSRRPGVCDNENEFYLKRNYWNKPENIKVDDLLNPENKFAVTLKVDGVRRFLFITRTGIFSCSPPRDIWKIGNGLAELDGTLLDTEAYRDDTGHVTYYVFDVLFDRGKDVRKEYFNNRLNILKIICPKLKFFKGETAQPKNFFQGPNFYENVEKAFEEAQKLEEQGIGLDGLIFQSHVWYKNFFTKKWKDPELLTTDFKLSASVKPEYGKIKLGKDEFVLLTKTENGYEPFRGSRRNPFIGTPIISLPGGLLKDIPNSGGLILNPPGDGTVVECKWDFENKVFVPFRYRDDKDEPNFNKVAADVWDDIVNPISEEDIKGYTLFAMRRFHNLVKRHFLTKEFHKGSTIMDWGSGRGGDIDKWDKIGIKKVFVVEPNDENFGEFERRLKSMQIKTEIIPVKRKGKLVGAEDTKTILDTLGSDPVDGIVSFFSLTFFGKDKIMFDKMIETIDKTLPVGGKFLGVVMDGNKVQKLLEQDTEAGEGESLIFDCPAFKITQSSSFEPEKIQKGKNEIEITIKEATSMVDQTEWLFYFSALKTALENIGFELKYDGFLDETGSPLLTLPQSSDKKEKRPSQLFKMLNKDGQTFSSLNRYFMFERTKTSSVQKPKKTSAKKQTPQISDNVDEVVDFPFNFPATFWSGAVPPEEEDKDFSLVRPVPIGIKYGIIHAILYAIDSKYRKLSSISERVDRVYSVLRMVSRKMSFELYCQAVKGPVYDENGKVITKKENLDNLELECAEFRVNLEADDETYMGILSHLLKINIMSIEVGKKDIILDSERKIFGCYENTIVVLKTPEEKRYEALVYTRDGKDFTAYSTKSAFIRNMIERIAKSKKYRGAKMKIRK